MATNNITQMNFVTITDWDQPRAGSNSRSSRSSKSSISTKEIEHVIENLRRQQHRNSMQKTYYVVWHLFNEFFVKLDIKPRNWEDRITLFVGQLIREGKCSATIESYISAIKAVLKNNKILVNPDKYLLSSLTKACKLVNDKVRARILVQKPMLMVMIKKLGILFENQPYLLHLYRALFITTYYGMFRIGELTLGLHMVKAVDIHIANNKDKMMFVLHTSKTHWKNVRPQTIKINGVKKTKDKNNLTNYCPFRLLRNYLRIRKSFKSKEEPFFMFLDRSPVKLMHYRAVFTKIIQLNSLKNHLYSVHCFRSGRACDLLAMVISVETIKKLGRWK